MRDAERDASRLNLLKSAARALASRSDPRQALDEVLSLAAADLMFEGGLVLGLEGSAFTVLASRGAMLPVGAQILRAGVLADLLKPPVQASLRERVNTRLGIGRGSEAALELILPMQLHARVVGAVALVSFTARPPLPGDELESLMTLATLMTAALPTSHPNRTRTARAAPQPVLARISPREQQVLALLPRGLSNAQIARELGIATGTVKVHVEHLLHKLGVTDRTQAAVKAIELGLKS